MTDSCITMTTDYDLFSNDFEMIIDTIPTVPTSNVTTSDCTNQCIVQRSERSNQHQHLLRSLYSFNLRSNQDCEERLSNSSRSERLICNSRRTRKSRDWQGCRGHSDHSKRNRYYCGGGSPNFNPVVVGV